MGQINSLEDLFHRRWAAPTMAKLWERGGEKFVTLFRTLGASQGAMRETLDFLIKERWVEKNPGYGHPMRPEYVLTARGAAVGERCHSLETLLRAEGLDEVCRTKWAIPVVVALGSGPLRYKVLAGRLSGATDRALVLCLRGLEVAGVLERDEEPAFPPAVTYGLRDVGRVLVDAATSLSKAIRL